MQSVWQLNPNQMKTIIALKQTKTMLLLLLCLASLSQVIAQKNFSVTDVLFSGGAQLMENPRLSNQSLLTLAPNSQLLQSNLAKYRSSNSIYGYSSTQGASLFSAQVGITPFGSGAKKSISPLLRIGISMGQVNLFNEFLSYSENFPYDTLISQRTGEKIYLDSTAGSQLNINQSGNQIRVDIALLYQTELDRWISFYSGIELGAGLTFNNQTQISKSDYGFGPGSFYYYGGNSAYQWENFANKNGYLVQTSIPIGFNLRMSKQKPLLNQVLLFFEFKPGISFFQIPEVKTFANFTYQTQAGLRFRI